MRDGESLKHLNCRAELSHCLSVKLTARGTQRSLLTERRPAWLRNLSLWVIFSPAFELNPFSKGFGLQGLTVVWSVWLNQEICIKTTLYCRIKDFSLFFPYFTCFQSLCNSGHWTSVTYTCVLLHFQGFFSRFFSKTLAWIFSENHPEWRVKSGIE